MKRALTILTILCAVLLTVSAQTTYSIELSAAGYLTGAPHSAGDATFLVGGATSKVLSYTTYEARPLSLKTTPTTIARTGVQYTVYTSGRLEFEVLGQLGVANGDVTSLAGAAGGKISYHPGWASAPGLYFVLSGQGVGQSAQLGGWNPEASIGIGYQLQGIGIGTLSARRKLAAMPPYK